MLRPPPRACMASKSSSAFSHCPARPHTCHQGRLEQALEPISDEPARLAFRVIDRARTDSRGRRRRCNVGRVEWLLGRCKLKLQAKFESGQHSLAKSHSLQTSRSPSIRGQPGVNLHRPTLIRVVNAGAPGRNELALRMAVTSPLPGFAHWIACESESRSRVGSPGRPPPPPPLRSGPSRASRSPCRSRLRFWGYEWSPPPPPFSPCSPPPPPSPLLFAGRHFGAPPAPPSLPPRPPLPPLPPPPPPSPRPPATHNNAVPGAQSRGWR